MHGLGGLDPIGVGQPRELAGTTITDALVRRVMADEHAKIRAELGDGYDDRSFDTAFQVLEQVALADEYVDFLTLPAYEAASA